MPLKPEVVAQLERVLASLEQLLPAALPPLDWELTWAANWRRHSFSGYLEPVRRIDPITLDDLLGIEEQKRLVVENTRQFLRGLPANNVLLWGTRGTGKSSLVRALLHAYADQGLRVVQVDKSDLVFLPDIFQAIQGAPYRFLLFCDDLSFEPGETTYKVLKSALDGSVYSAPANVLIYVTSNRRHLIPEYPTDHLGEKLVDNEVQRGESVEEKRSLSDRFGLWVPFRSFSQEHYLTVVRQCLALQARDQGLELPWSEDLARQAIQWSHDKSKRCGRTALQFAVFTVGRSLLGKLDDSVAQGGTR